MFHFLHKENKPDLTVEYDRENERPVLHCSICTGEQVAGFKHIHTGKFRDVMLIRNEKDLRWFQDACGVSDLPRDF